jgi:hypothetical protein
MSLPNLPLTVQALNYYANWTNVIAIGQNASTLYLSLGDSTLTNTYWFVVIDRVSLKVVANFTTKDNSSVPTQLSPYLGNTQYLLIVSTQNLGSAYLPHGALYAFLESEGAGVELKRLEQIYATLNCGTWGFMAYSFVCVLGDDGSGAFEASTLQQNALLQTIQLMPINIGGTNYYTPISL